MCPPGRRSASLATLIAAVVCGCTTDGPLAPACAAPIVTRAAATTDTTNVLRTFVTANVHGADSVIVRFGVGVARDSATPSLTLTGDSVVATVLGLEPSRTYGAQLVAFNACGTAASDVITFTTAALPADLPAYTAERIDPSPGYVVFGASSYGLVIDNAGRVVGYHRFPDGVWLDFHVQPPMDLPILGSAARRQASAPSPDIQVRASVSPRHARGSAGARSPCRPRPRTSGPASTRLPSRCRCTFASASARCSTDR